MFRKTRWLFIASVVMVIAIVLGACGTPAAPPPAETATPPPEETAAPPEPTPTPFEAPEVAMSYTFTMQEGVTFHEGGTLEPHDLAYSMWRGMLQDRSGGPQWMILEPLLGYSSIEDLAEEVGDVTACEWVKASVTYDDDAGTVTFNLATPFAPWMQIMAQPFAAVMDMEWMIEQGAWDGDCATWRDWHDPEAEESVIFDQMNGTGPYVLEYWHPGEELSWVRNENYWRTQQNVPIWEDITTPAMERIVIKRVDEWSTRLAMTEAGDCDNVQVDTPYIAQVEPLVNEMYVGGEKDPDKLTIVNPNGTLRLYKDLPTVLAADSFFNWNVNVEGGNPFVGSGELDGNGIPPDFFSDIHLRKAFNYCFDWDTFIEDVYMGEAIQRRGPIIEGMFGYNPDQEVFTHDLAKCEEEFKLAWDGAVWESGFYLTYVYNTGNDVRRAAGEIYEANVESVNPKFNISIVDMPWPAYLKQLVDSRLTFFTIGWLEDFHHPHNWVQPYMHSNGAFAAFAGWPEDLAAEFDAKVEECVGLTGDEAEQCYFDLQAMAYENVTNVWLAQPTDRRYEQMWMEGYYYNPSYFGRYPFTQVTGKTGGDDPTTFVYCEYGEPETLDPNWHYDTASAEAIWQTYESPVFFLRERVDAFVPGLASEWEISE